MALHLVVEVVDLEVVVAFVLMILGMAMGIRILEVEDINLEVAAEHHLFILLNMDLVIELKSKDLLEEMVVYGEAAEVVHMVVEVVHMEEMVVVMY